MPREIPKRPPPSSSVISRTKKTLHATGLLARLDRVGTWRSSEPVAALPGTESRSAAPVTVMRVMVPTRMRGLGEDLREQRRGLLERRRSRPAPSRTKKLTSTVPETGWGPRRRRRMTSAESTVEAISNW